MAKWVNERKKKNHNLKHANTNSAKRWSDSIGRLVVDM